MQLNFESISLSIKYKGNSIDKFKNYFFKSNADSVNKDHSLFFYQYSCLSLYIAQIFNVTSSLNLLIRFKIQKYIFLYKLK